MGRGGNGFKRYWHDRRAELPDGDTLRYLVIARPGVVPFVAYFRTDHRGGLHPTQGRRLLEEIHHPDAGLEVLGDRPSPADVPLSHAVGPRVVELRKHPGPSRPRDP